MGKKKTNHNPGPQPGQKICPLLRGPCVQQGCEWYIHVRGSNPQTGQEVDSFNCTMAWQPLLMIENSQAQRQTGAAVESFRNEMVKANQASQQILIAAANPHLLTGGN